MAELGRCQARARGRRFQRGYLSAFPESFFDRVEAGLAVWAASYMLHKIMAGLLDAYLLPATARRSPWRRGWANG